MLSVIRYEVLMDGFLPVIEKLNQEVESEPV